MLLLSQIHSKTSRRVSHSIRCVLVAPRPPLPTRCNTALLCLRAISLCPYPALLPSLRKNSLKRLGTCLIHCILSPPNPHKDSQIRVRTLSSEASHEQSFMWPECKLAGLSNNAYNGATNKLQTWILTGT